MSTLGISALCRAASSLIPARRIGHTHVRDLPLQSSPSSLPPPPPSPQPQLLIFPKIVSRADHLPRKHGDTEESTTGDHRHATETDKRDTAASGENEERTRVRCSCMYVLVCVDSDRETARGRENE